MRAGSLRHAARVIVRNVSPEPYIFPTPTPLPKCHLPSFLGGIPQLLYLYISLHWADEIGFSDNITMQFASQASRASEHSIEVDATWPSKRQRTILACNRCRSRKIKVLIAAREILDIGAKVSAKIF